MTAPKVNWPGKSGKTYEYYVHPIGTAFVSKPGNYIYAASAGGKWKACYIGQTKDLKERLADHEKEACAKRHGATHIHAHVTTGGEVVRKAEEKDLILAHQPPCNDQLK